jgi:adenosylcobinamide kinase/adenosylcobinamide-phosphate guanylyltransferase
VTGTGRRVLVLGGARSGKSAHAEALLAGATHVDYIATATHDAADAEWAERIARHRERRPRHWRTVETIDLAAALGRDGSPALIDSVTAWLTAVMDVAGSWQDEVQARVVAVSDEVGSGVVPDSASGRLFRDTLGLLNQRLAASADEVWLVTAGIPLQLR